MYLKNRLFLSGFISVFFLIFNYLIASSSSAYVDEQYASCLPANSSCGPSVEIRYPFWDTTHTSLPNHCVYPGFELSCQGDALTIQIKNQTYNVLDINYETNIFTVVKQQFSQGPCPKTEAQLTNSTLDLSLFDFTSTVENATIFYKCERTAAGNAPFSFTCEENSYLGEPSTDFTSDLNFVAKDDKWKNELPKHCAVMIYLPVFKSQLEDLGKLNIDDVLSKGFELKWTIDDSRCQDCLGSNGRCGYNYTLNQPVCFCQYGASNGTCAKSYAPEGVVALTPLSSPGPPLSSQDQKSPSNKTTVIGGVVAAAAIGILLSILFFVCRRNYRQNRSIDRALPHTSALRTFSTTLDANASTYFGVEVLSYSALEEATEYFNPTKEIGAGGFGTVYYGVLPDGREVAVKRLNENSNRRAEQFLNEVEILANLSHKNLVNLYGCTSRHSRELLLVYEYVPNGTVADHLHGKNAKLGLLPWPTRLGIAIETACALVYLHASDIIHRDVKTQNILLDKNFSVKVADFGLSRLFPLNVSHVSTAPQGTPGYLDPEYHQCYQLTEKSDVYSFGVLLAELLSSKPAVDVTRRRADINLCNMLVSKITSNALDDFIDPSLGFQSDFEVKKEIMNVADLALQCLQSTRDMRPSMQQVLETLYNIKDHKYKIDRPEVVDIPFDDYSSASSPRDDGTERTLLPHDSV